MLQEVGAVPDADGVEMGDAGADELSAAGEARHQVRLDESGGDLQVGLGVGGVGPDGGAAGGGAGPGGGGGGGGGGMEGGGGGACSTAARGSGSGGAGWISSGPTTRSSG